MRVSAVVLAAGRSSRMGTNKLLLPWGEGTILGAVLKALEQSKVHEILVVTGSGRTEVEAALRMRTTFHNPRFEEGMGTSIAAGVRAVDPNAAGFLIVLGDMPRISSVVIGALLEQATPHHIIVPVYRERQGNPVLFGSRFRGELEALTGDRGARSVLLQNPDAIRYFEVDDESIFDDVDTPSDLKPQ